MPPAPQVSIITEPESAYPQEPPYHPDSLYPELQALHPGVKSTDNPAYRMTRRALAALSLDQEHFGTPRWNPLGAYIQPGNTVVIKPNAVWDVNPNQGQSVFASITHGSLIRPMVDYAHIALKGRGRIVIADAPLMHSDFAHWKELTGLAAMQTYYRQMFQFDLEVLDLRLLYVPWDRATQSAPFDQRVRTERDPAGYCEIDLGAGSAFHGLPAPAYQRLYGSDYDREQTVSHHSIGSHSYCVAQTILDADCLISIPKLKTHSKVGLTLNIKGMVGTQGDKNYIPHHRLGGPWQGGDEYPDLGLIPNLANTFRSWTITHVLNRQTRGFDRLYRGFFFPLNQLLRRAANFFLRRSKREFKTLIAGGAWYGNDTAWRMALDLIRIVIYADRKGRMQPILQRRFFSLVDGILAGEGNGPLTPTAKACGVILAGDSPLAVDLAAAHLMGFDYRKIPMLSRALDLPALNTWNGKVENITTVGGCGYDNLFLGNPANLAFQPAGGWKGHLELEGGDHAAVG